MNPADRSRSNTECARRITSSSCSVSRSCSTSMPTTVAICARSSPYTESSTQTVSESTSCDTHAPCATNASAHSTCAGSSLTISRTRTLVSTARMRAPCPGPNTCIHVGDAPVVRRRIEHGLVNVPRRVLRRPPHDDFVPDFAPLDLRTGRQSEPAADTRRHRHLPLDGDLRFDSFHLFALSPIPCPRIVASITMVRQTTGRRSVSPSRIGEWNVSRNSLTTSASALISEPFQAARFFAEGAPDRPMDRRELSVVRANQGDGFNGLFAHDPAPTACERVRRPLILLQAMTRNAPWLHPYGRRHPRHCAYNRLRHR